MSSAFSIALSALQANSEAIDSTGNNLANMNTVGYKASSVDFETLISQHMGQGVGFQVGMGVGTPVNEQLFSQGPIQNSSSPLACAIQGNGFFVVNNSGGQQLFTRDGDFAIDKNGQLVTQTGETVQGWVANNTGSISTTAAPSNIVLPAGQVLPASPTTKFSMTANLDASTAVGQTWTQTLPAVDSLGNNQNLTVTFTNNGPNSWGYNVSIPGSSLAGGSASANVSLMPTTPLPPITFNSDGSMNTSMQYVAGIQTYAAPAAATTFTFTPASGPAVTASIDGTTGDTLADAITSINAQLAAAGSSITAAQNANGTGICFQSATSFTVADSSGTMLAGSGTSASVSSALNSITLALPAGQSLADHAAFGDSTNHQIAWSLLDTAGAGTLTQYAQASGVETKNIDGSQAAQLTGFAIQNGGQIVATFSNGAQQTEGQLALASIQNPDSLQSVGDNNFAASGATSTPAIGVPLTGGRGQILGASLEGSTVDMATEFTKLITYQSGYQASSRVISTADQMTQDLMNLIH